MPSVEVGQFIRLLQGWKMNMLKAILSNNNIKTIIILLTFSLLQQ